MGNTEVKQSDSGLRVTNISPNSPLLLAGLTEFVDFIIEISGQTERIPLPPAYLRPISLQNSNGVSEEPKVTLRIYNVLYRKTRAITVNVPQETEAQRNLLGLVVRQEDYKNAHERVLRVVKVYPNSPADIAGLRENEDYIIGSTQFSFQNIEDFAAYVPIIEEKTDIKGVEVCVYNSEAHKTRMITIIPNKNWGGKGSLGCEFAVGIVNYLPLLEEDVKVSQMNLWKEENGAHKEEDNKETEPTPLLIEVSHAEEGPGKQAEEKPSEINLTKKRSYSAIEGTKNTSDILMDSEDSKKVQEEEVHEQNGHPHSTTLYQQKASILKTYSGPKPLASVFIQGTGPNSNVQLQKVSIKSMPKPQIKVQYNESSLSNSINDMSPIPQKTSVGTLGSTTNLRNAFNSFGRPKSSSQTLVSSGPSSPSKVPAAKEERQQAISTRQKRKLTDGSQRGEKNTQKQEDEVVEVYFQGIERIDHLEDEVFEFPKVVMINPQDLTNMTTTVLDRSGAESQNKSLETAETYEKPVCKTVIQYTFHSKKLGGDYIIKSTDLFSIVDLKKIN